MKCLLPGLFATLLSASATAQVKNDAWLGQLLREKGSPMLKMVLDHPDSFHYQIIYTQINRDKNNQPHCKNYYLRVNSNDYINPASTVKLPVALSALEKLNTLQVPGLDRNTVMLTDSSYSGQVSWYKDSLSVNGLPSIGQYIKEIFLVSDNDAYNRLYEFVGQKTLNENLRDKGYATSRITRRFMPMSEEENRHTNSIRFERNGQPVYHQPAAYSQFPFDFSRKIGIGKGYLNRKDSLVNEPMDFTTHNNFPLEDLQRMLQSVIFPTTVNARQRFLLTDDDRQFLLQYMSERPSESGHPHYDSTEYFDSYCKFFMFRAGKLPIPAHIRIFNKPGWSYGFLTDAAYIVDFSSQAEFIISACLYVNSDGILNDDKYEYESIGYPFFAEAGRIIYEYELNRHRKHIPDLSGFRLDYRDR